MGRPVFSKAGKTIFASGVTPKGELVRLDSKTGQFEPFLRGISASLMVFSKDGQAVAYVSYLDGVLWMANKDGSGRGQLSGPPLQQISVSWSPDGTEVSFMSPSPQGRLEAWIVPSQGGDARRLLPEDNGQQTDPSWSPDGGKIIFAADLTFAVGGKRQSTIRILDLASH